MRNVQFATTPGSGVLVGVAVTNSGSAAGELPPMLEQLHKRHEQTPPEALVGGGLTRYAAIGAAQVQALAESSS